MARRLADLGCPESRIRLVRIGLDLAEFPFDPPRPTRPLVVLQTCRFVEKKGVDLTIRAFAAARRDLGASELWLVGDGVLRPELEALARRLGVHGSVRFLGMLAGPEYRRVVRRAHIGIQPSRTAADGQTEGGAPTVLLELQAVGIPVVATRHADIPAVVPEPGELAEEEDVDGLAEALVRVASRTPRERRIHAERGRSLVETMHDARVIAGEIEAIYDEALGGAPARPEEGDTRLLLEPVGMLSGRSGDDGDNAGLGR
jgi:colanic acid/amylovoran biosynthesis glycosyltransferase